MDQAQQARRPVAQLGARAGGLPARQRGWIGLIGILIALVIVAVLARTVLKSYGLLSDEEAKRVSGRVPPAASAAPIDPTSVPATPGATIERARSLEQQVQRDAQQQEKRIDESTH
jgi:hypothetical protein